MDNTITIICAVAAEFEDHGKKYVVQNNDRNIVLTAPAWIAKTLMFKWLAEDGSLKYVTPVNRIQVENNPTVGLNAEGKAEVKAEATEATAEKPKNSRRKAAKGADGESAAEEA